MSFYDLTVFDFKSAHMIKIMNTLKESAYSNANIFIFGPPGSGKTNLVKNLSQIYNVNQTEFAYFDSLNRDYDFNLFLKESTSSSKNICIENIDKLTASEQNKLISVLSLEKKYPQSRFIFTSRFDLDKKFANINVTSGLYSYLTEIKLEMPSLNERLEDFETLTDFMCDVNNIIYGRKLRLTPKAVQKLKSWNWTENLRELEGVIERAYINCHESVIDCDEIQFIKPENLDSNLFLGMSLSEMEQRLIKQTLNLTNQNRTKAADILGISIRTLRNKINEYRKEGHYEFI